MKNFYLAMFLFSSMAFGRNFGFVDSLKGKVFSSDRMGEVKVLKNGDPLYVNMEIQTEKDSFLIITDYSDRKFTLLSHSHLKLGRDSLTLKKGVLKIKNIFDSQKAIHILTANSKVKFSKGEGIISYAQEEDITQVVSLDGTLSIKSSSFDGPMVEVYGGFFSIVDSAHKGIPTGPQEIGKNSLVSTLKPFKGIERSPAGQQRPAKKIILIRASQSKKKKAPTKKRLGVILAPVKIRIHGRRMKSRDISSIEDEGLVKDLKKLK